MKFIDIKGSKLLVKEPKECEMSNNCNIMAQYIEYYNKESMINKYGKEKLPNYCVVCMDLEKLLFIECNQKIYCEECYSYQMEM